MLSPRWGPGHVGQELGKTVVEVDYMGRVWMMLDALEEIAYYGKYVCCIGCPYQQIVGAVISHVEKCCP